MVSILRHGHRCTQELGLINGVRVSQAKTWDRDKHGCVAVGQRGRGRGRPGLFASGSNRK